MKYFSIFLIACMGYLLISISALAAENTTPHRLAVIQEIYGVHIEYDDYGAHFLDRQLYAIESALYQVGPHFTYEVNNIRIVSFRPKFRILISGDVPASHPNVVGQHHITAEYNTIHLYPSPSYIPTASDIVHEFGHAAAYLSHGAVDVYADFIAINGAYGHQHFDPNRYVSVYAMTNVSEDFAEVFMVVVQSGGNNPTTVPRDTVLYRKFEYMQAYLLDQLGPDSWIVIQASAFLGIDPHAPLIPLGKGGLLYTCRDDNDVNSQKLLQ